MLELINGIRRRGQANSKSLGIPCEKFIFWKPKTNALVSGLRRPMRLIAELLDKAVAPLAKALCGAPIGLSGQAQVGATRLRDVEKLHRALVPRRLPVQPEELQQDAVC